MNDLNSVFWISLGASALLSFPIYVLLIKLKSRQTVSQYAPEGHQIKQGTPTMGGLIALAGILAGLGYFAAFRAGDGSEMDGHHGAFRASNVWMIVGLTLAFAAIGFIDDFVVPRLLKGKRGLGWKQKIVMQFLAGAFVLPALDVPFTPTNFAIAIFVVLFFSNAYNFADGLDGLAASLGILLFVGLGILGVFLASELPIFVSLAAVAGLIVFLFLNAPPAKVFMGDVGSLPIGALLGFEVLDILLRTGIWQASDSVTMGSSLNYSNVALALLILSFMMIVELVPVPLQILSVKLRKKKLFPYTPIHHAFEKAGWPESRVVWIFALVQFLCVAAALSIFTLGSSSR